MQEYKNVDGDYIAMVEVKRFCVSMEGFYEKSLLWSSVNFLDLRFLALQ